MLGFGITALRGYGQRLILQKSEVLGKSINFCCSQNICTSEVGFSRPIFPLEWVNSRPRGLHYSNDHRFMVSLRQACVN